MILPIPVELGARVRLNLGSGRCYDPPAVNAVKVDVEGAEHLVVTGMRALLARLRPRFVICETALDSPAAVTLERAGYRGWMLEPMRADGRWGNVLFEPQGTEP